MHEPPARQCGSCYFGRQVAGQLCCVRNPPAPDPATAQARWPIVQPTDHCGAFYHKPPNPHSQSPDNQSSIINHQSQAPVPTIINNQSSIINPLIHSDHFGDYCKIPLTQGKFAKVDPEDYLWLSQFRWCCKMNVDNCYAVRHVQVRGKSKRIYMHRQIMNTPNHLVCDHINHDGLDNRRKNCRNCTTAQNNSNRRSAPTASSRYLGVSYDPRRNKWTAHIKKHGRSRYLGSFDIEADAARAYDRAAITLHGPYAALNFPDEAIRDK